MNRGQLKTLLRALVFDRTPAGQAGPFADSVLEGFLEAAQHEVGAFARSQDASVRLAEATATAEATPAGPLTYLELDEETPAPEVRRLLAARLETPAAGETPATSERLGIKDFADCDLELTGSRERLLTLLGGRVALLNAGTLPESGTFRLWYVCGLPALASDNSVPALPAEYHDLIALEAAVTLLKSERAEWAGLQDTLDRRKASRQAQAARDGRPAERS